MSDLLTAVKGSPLLLAFVVVLAALIYAIEKLGGLDGPMTRLWGAWQNRELNRLHRESLLRAERRRMEAEEDAERMADLAAKVERLRATVNWLTSERNDQIKRDRIRDGHDVAIADYVHRLLRAARSAGVAFVDPPDPPDLAAMFISPDDLDDEPDSRNSPAPEPVGR